MIYKVNHYDSKSLLEMPETGMGYQIIKAKIYNQKKVRFFVVYNSELAIELNSKFKTDFLKNILNGYKLLLDKATELMFETDTIKVYSIQEIITNQNSKISNNFSKMVYTNLSCDEYANGNDIFVRLSVYENDKRIDFNNSCLIPGTFATTLQDYNDCLNKNEDPKNRYSIQGNASIKWAFFIKPKIIDILHKAKIESTFINDGGGIEVSFCKGTSINTLISKTSIDI